MVTITNGDKTFSVTAGSIKPYLGMGFRVVSDKELEDMKQGHKVHHNDSGMVDKRKDAVTNGKREDEVIEDDYSEDAVFVEELLEKPLSQWSSEEVKDFVRIKNIDTSGAQKVSQVRAIIKRYLEEEQKNKEV